VFAHIPGDIVFQAPPPPPPPPEIVRTESSYLQVARKDVPMTLAKDKRTENALIRYQLFVRTDVEARQAPAVPDAAPPPVFCQWVVTVYLEREPCFESISGKMACGERYTVRLRDQERGKRDPAANRRGHGLRGDQARDRRGQRPPGGRGRSQRRRTLRRRPDPPPDP
jgi:hypothetical protein